MHARVRRRTRCQPAFRSTLLLTRDGVEGRPGDGPGRTTVRIQLQGQPERRGRLRRRLSELEDRGRELLPTVLRR